MKSLLYFVLAMAVLGCGSNDSAKQVEELKKEKAQLQKQLDSKSKSERVEKAASDNYERILGFWFTPHAAMLNMKFTRDSRFVFNDFNTDLNINEELTGRFELHNTTLTLFYDDRPKQSFTFKRGKDGDDNYYITKNGYYFVKGMNGGQ
jgi:hypothetical protein